MKDAIAAAPFIAAMASLRLRKGDKVEELAEVY